MDPRPDPEIDATARRWLARLQAHDCSPADRVAFQRWHDADPLHAATYAELQDLWQRSAGIRRRDDAFDAALREARMTTPARPRRIRAWLPALAVAASVTLVVALLFRLYGPEDPLPVRYATALGEQRTVGLDDGSRLILDTDTEVQVRYGRRERHLHLARGQAEFQVARDVARPFTVEAEGSTVTALGTRFQVRVASGGGSVTLLEGQVAVEVPLQQGGKAARATLAAGERIAFRAATGLGAKEALPDADLARLRGWTEGQLVVRDWPLEAVVAELNRYSGTRLELGDPALKALPISGRFKTADPKTFALSLEYGWPIRSEQPAPDRIVLRPR